MRLNRHVSILGIAFLVIAAIRLVTYIGRA